MADEQDLVRSVTLMMSEAEIAPAHFRVYRDLTLTLSDEHNGLGFFVDFVEVTIEAHLSAVVLTLTRMFDRDSRARSFHWLINYVESHPSEFRNISIAPSELREMLRQLKPAVSKLFRTRNSWVAHRPQMTKQAVDLFWNSYGLSEEEVFFVCTEVLSILKTITSAHTEHACRWVVFGIEEETDEVLQAFRKRSIERDRELAERDRELASRQMSSELSPRASIGSKRSRSKRNIGRNSHPEAR